MALQRRFQIRSALRACGLAAVFAAGVAGCSSSQLNTLNDNLPGAVALPAGSPQRPDQTPAFPAVHDMPPPRSNVTLSPEEQVKLEDDLSALRARQEAVAGTAPAAKKKPPMPAAPRVVPAASTNTIY